MSKSLGSVLLIVDDWEALERYEDRLAPWCAEIEAWPLSKEGLQRAMERMWDWILLDLTSEDVTLEEACRCRTETDRSRWFLVGSEEELRRLQLEGLVRASDRMISRPFDWQALIGQFTGSQN